MGDHQGRLCRGRQWQSHFSLALKSACGDHWPSLRVLDELQMSRKGNALPQTPVFYLQSKLGGGTQGRGGHRAYLRSGPSYDFVRYRQLVHEITLAFNGISQEILQIKGQLEGPHGRADLAQHLRRIQEKEKEKLELTAELQLAKQNVQDHPGVGAHEQEVRELKQKLIQTIEAISEILQDFKYDSEESS